MTVITARETELAVKYVPDTDPDHEFILPKEEKRNDNSVTVKVSGNVIYVCLMGFDFISADPRIVGNDLPKNRPWKPESERSGSLALSVSFFQVQGQRDTTIVK